MSLRIGPHSLSRCGQRATPLCRDISCDLQNFCNLGCLSTCIVCLPLLLTCSKQMQVLQSLTHMHRSSRGLAAC